MSDRQIIVVDVETTGLDPLTHTVIEVAWCNLATGEAGYFIPPHRWGLIASVAEPDALRINRYLERIPGRTQDRGGYEGMRLGEALEGNVLAGSNPSFDAAFLTEMFREYVDRNWVADIPAWHHRMLDLSAYAAGVLGIELAELPGLGVVCERLGVNEPDHTAPGDVAVTVECFRILRELSLGPARVEAAS